MIKMTKITELNSRNVDTSRLEVGMIIRNYKEMCKILEEEPLSSCGKKTQLENWKRFFKWINVGQRFVIKEIYDEPLDVVLEKRKLVSQKIEYTTIDDKNVVKIYDINDESQYTLIDTEYIEQVMQANWRINKYGYFYGNINREQITLHQFIARLAFGEYDKENLVVDHKNRERNDNRVSNLRLIKQSENMKNLSTKKNNKSGHAGVTEMHYWKATITVDRKVIKLGCFSTYEEALKARVNAEIKYGVYSGDRIPE